VLTIQVLMSPGCGHGPRAAALVEELAREHSVAVRVERVQVESLEDAKRLSFPGSPTVRVDGIDIEPDAPTSVGLG